MINISDIYPLDPLLHSGSYMAGLVRSILMRSNFVMHQRQALGWRGLRPACRGGDGWTCRIEGKEGVYGIYFTGEEATGDGLSGTFSLCYFPEPEEEIIDNYSVQAALYTQFPQYNGMVRDFLSHPDFYWWFEIAELHVSVSVDLKALWTSMVGQERMYISCTDEIKGWMGSASTLPLQLEELNQDLPAFDLAFPFLEIFISTMVDALECDVQKLVQGKSGEKKLVGAGFGNVAFTGEWTKNLLLWESGSGKTRPFPEARWWSPMADFGTEPLRTSKKGIDSKPKLVVLTGFLGSGKTSFLKQFIEYHVQFNRFVAVIQNEIGEQGLDGNLLEDDYAVLEMDEGCICCSLVSQLKKGIKKILDDHHPEVIILETTGLANPYNLLDEIHEIQDLVRFQSVCTIVDGKNFFRSTSYSSLVVDQLKAANKVLLNKTDLLKKSEQAEVLDRISSLNPQADIFPCSYGKVNPSRLFEEESEYWDTYNLTQKPAEYSGTVMHHDHSNDGISSWKYILKSRLEKKFVMSEMENLPESIFRVKGVVDIEGQSAPCVLQYVNGICSLEEMTHNIPEDRFLIFIGKSNALIQQTIFFN